MFYSVFKPFLGHKTCSEVKTTFKNGIHKYNDGLRMFVKFVGAGVGVGVGFGVGRGRGAWAWGVGVGFGAGRARGRGWRLLFFCCCFRCCYSQKSQFTVCRSINCLKIDCTRKNNVLNEIKSRQLNSTSYPKSRVLRIYSKFGHQACWIDWPTKYIEYNRKWGLGHLRFVYFI